ncbi:hypothetical protein DOY81_001873 [Sarcophaga bullata]|nr:hypothetical protein DOY81_001873 [Sarcophaga bullata]
MTISQLLTSLQVAINVWGLPPKCFAMYISLKLLRKGRDIMDILDQRCTREEEFAKIKRCIILCNRATVFYVSFYTTYAFTTMVTSMIMGMPPYNLIFPVMDWRASGYQFVLQSVIEFLLMCTICLHQGTDDVYAFIYIYILRTHMQILVERVLRFGREENADQITDDEYYAELTISPAISRTIFCQFTITAVILGTTLINIFIFADLTAQIASVLYFLAVMVQTSPACYQATCLLDDAEQLSHSILHCEWFSRDKRFRKMLIFFMMKSQEPLSLTAMKLFPITLNTSISIAKFSFSLYTLIKEMDFGQHAKK